MANKNILEPISEDLNEDEPLINITISVSSSTQNPNQLGTHLKRMSEVIWEAPLEMLTFDSSPRQISKQNKDSLHGKLEFPILVKGINIETLNEKIKLMSDFQVPNHSRVSSSITSEISTYRCDMSGLISESESNSEMDPLVASSREVISEYNLENLKKIYWANEGNPHDLLYLAINDSSQTAPNFEKPTFWEKIGLKTSREDKLLQDANKE